MKVNYKLWYSQMQIYKRRTYLLQLSSVGSYATVQGRNRERRKFYLDETLQSIELHIRDSMNLILEEENGNEQ